MFVSLLVPSVDIDLQFMNGFANRIGLIHLRRRCIGVSVK